jgi:hypothetical protein
MSARLSSAVTAQKGCVRLLQGRFDERQHATDTGPNALTGGAEEGRLGSHSTSGPRTGDRIAAAIGEGRSPPQSNVAELLQATVLLSPSAAPRRAKAPSGRKPGGQPGHEGHGRTLKPETEVDPIIEVRPESCEPWGTLLLGDNGEPEGHQGTDVPRSTPVVTEYRRHRLCCGVCGASTQAAWPATMPPGSFGPRVQATVGI